MGRPVRPRRRVLAASVARPSRALGIVWAIAIAVLASASACDDSSRAVDTPLVSDAPGGAGGADVVSNADTGGASPRDVATAAPKRPPRLTIESPPNGLWAAEMAEVVLSGRVTPGSAPVSGLKLGDESIPLGTDGRFSVPLTPQAGINLVGLRAEGEDGGRAVDERAFFAGPNHAPGTLLPRAAYAHLTTEFLDDDDDDPDDLARLTELLLENPEFLALLDVPIEAAGLVLQPTGVTVADAHVDVFAGDGVLTLVARLVSPEIRFQTNATNGEAPSAGFIAASEAELQLGLALRLEGGVVVATTEHVGVVLDGFRMEADLFPDYFDDPAVLAVVRGVVEDGIRDEVSLQVGELISGLLGALAFDFSYGETVPIRFQLALDELQVTREGLHAVFSAAASAPLGVGVHNAEIAGSLHTPSTPPSLAFAQAPVAFAVDDDLLNQLAFAYWYGGGLTNFVLGAEDMESVGATELPDVFSPLERVSVSATLPLVVTPQPDVPGFPFALSVGDMQVVLETGDARRFGMFLSLRAGVDIVAGGEDGAPNDGLARFSADRRPAQVPVHVGAYAVPSGNDPGNVAALVRMMVPPILGRTNEGLPGFPIPGVPLSYILDLPSLATKEFAIPDVHIRTVGAEGHFIVLEGAPVMQDIPPEEPPTL